MAKRKLVPLHICYDARASPFTVMTGRVRTALERAFGEEMMVNKPFSAETLIEKLSTAAK